MYKTNKQKKRRESRRQTLVILAVFAAVVAVCFLLFQRLYSTSISNILYRERLSQLEDVTSQLFYGLEDVTDDGLDVAIALRRYVEQSHPGDTEALCRVTSMLDSINATAEKKQRFIAVDEAGRYLTADGWQGEICQLDQLPDDEDGFSYIAPSTVPGETSIFFLSRMESNIVIRDNGRSVRILYYGVEQNMQRFSRFFHCEVYGENSIVYVLDNSGECLYRNRGSDILSSSNAYRVLDEAEHMYSNSFAQAKEDFNASGLGYANTVLNGEEYYYALYQVNDAAWSLLFLVPSSCVASDVVGLVDASARLIWVFSLTLLVISTATVFLLLLSKHRQNLAMEQMNIAEQARINRELSIAVESAERAEKEAKKANRAKSVFLANMSHDIRTPMNAIMGLTKLMEHEKNDPDKLDIYIRKLQASSRHLLSLINDVLDMSRIESSEVTLNREPIRLSDQIDQINSIIRPQVEERGQDYMVLVHELGHEFFITDAVRLRQILLNLLSNAVKYTPQGGTIRLILSELPSDNDEFVMLRIAVTDNGCGMTPEFLQHIFEPFTRAENSMTNKVQGTGLGMAITKSIVDLMGGTITVESEPGRGSRFEVTLPMLIDKNAACLTINSKGILLCSGEEADISNAHTFSQALNIPFYTARTREEGNAILRKYPVDTILLMDFVHSPALPKIVEAIRAETDSSVLIFCADYAQPEQVADIIKRAGVNGLIERPLFLSSFANAVNQTRSFGAVQKPEEGAGLRGLRFLCAEDNALNAEILDALMDMNDASCVIYPNGRELVDAFVNVKPGEFDAILMDVQMPVMNGLEAARAIRGGSNPLGRSIPIIAMTANAFSADVQDCLNAGMDAHVPKPLDIAMLERVWKTLSCPGGATNRPPSKNTTNADT